MKTQAHQEARQYSSAHEDSGTSRSKTIFKCSWRRRHIKRQDNIQVLMKTQAHQEARLYKKYIQVLMKTQAHQGARLYSSAHEDLGTSRTKTVFKCSWRPRHIKDQDYIQVYYLAAAAATAQSACINYNQTTQDAVISSTTAVALAPSAHGDVKKKHAGLVPLSDLLTWVQGL